MMNSNSDKICEICNACAAIDDWPTVQKESQQVPGIKIESYILAPFPNILTFSRGSNVKRSLTSYRTRTKNKNN